MDVTVAPAYFLFRDTTISVFPDQDIMSVPPVASVCPPNQCETFESQQVASDCMWSDPARDEQVTIISIVSSLYAFGKTLLMKCSRLPTLSLIACSHHERQEY